MLDARVEDAAHERFEQIADYYGARLAAYEDDPAKADYRPLKPDRLYLERGGISSAAGERARWRA